MANRWKKMGTVADFIFLGNNISADGDCSHKIKRHLFLGRKAMTNLDSILKNRDITLLFFSEDMWGILRVIWAAPAIKASCYSFALLSPF